MKTKIIFDKVASKIRCRQMRLRILEISQKVSALHIAPAFSCLEMTDVIYSELMKRDQNTNKFSDIFIMSKGHGCMAQYVTLEYHNILSVNELNNYCSIKGILGAHPDLGNPGIEASTGSLGHGLGLAVGMAYAEKLKQTNTEIFTILSDGELQEGSTWESAMMASNLKLKNINLFIDLNDFGGMHRMSEYHQSFYPLKEKFDAFGWNCVIVDGHDASAIYYAYHERSSKKPFAMICNTVKGKGVSFMENAPMWHYRSPSAEEYTQALEQILRTE